MTGAALSPRSARNVRRAERWIELGDLDAARRSLAEAESEAPRHAEVELMRAALLEAEGSRAQAHATLAALVKRVPADAGLLVRLGIALRRLGDAQTAYAVLLRASELAPGSADAWLRLGEILRDGAYVERATTALTRAHELRPQHVPTRIALADTLTMAGRIDEAAAELRGAIALDPRAAQAWQMLADLKTVRFTPAELDALEQLWRDTTFAPDDHADIGFALAAGLDAAQRYAEAYGVLVDANAAHRAGIEWDRDAFSAKIDACIAAYARPIARANDDSLGANLVFIVSLPRSGSTLTEQILASHSEVEGGGELPHLSDIIVAEGERRGAELPDWAADATPADWERLAHEYLKRTQRQRASARVLVDKGLSNWMLIGAIGSMFPAARVIDCRRDPLETCFACFRQRFRRGSNFAYDLDDIVAFWRDYDRLMHVWRTRESARIFEQRYEDLTADPEAGIRRLLENCGLAFEDACLRFHETRRRVATASAAQVRTPLRRDTARAATYGALLDPLRAKLAAASA
ncbi:MAG TPA: sulfotransferase [Rhodanobacteraceae bacterium]|nr:sulfotransferase [Rhodanobacteraceae bacterium]